MRVGIAGTGKMGSAIARRLLSLDHQVTVWNRTAERALPLVDAGAGVAASPAALAREAELVITVLTGEQALDEVYFGKDGLASEGAAGKLFIDMSTVKPDQQRAMAAGVERAGAAYLECPVGGSVGPAQEGKLLGFVGGAESDLARARPVLEQLCRRIEHVGGHGAGATLKLAVNLPLMVYWQALGEALSLVQPLGLDFARVIDILTESSGGPNMLKARGAMIAQALSGLQTSHVTVDVATMRKDLQAMLKQGHGSRRQMPLTALTLECLDRAAASGLDQVDCTQLPRWWLDEGATSTPIELVRP